MENIDYVSLVGRTRQGKNRRMKELLKRNVCSSWVEGHVDDLEEALAKCLIVLDRLNINVGEYMNREPKE